MAAEDLVETRAAATALVDVDELSARAVDLVRSAYRVMAARGSHRLSLQDVADAAGVSKGLVLYHFKSKDRLLITTMNWALVRTAERIRQRLEGLGERLDAQQAVGALVDSIFVGPEPNRRFQLVYLDLCEHAARDEAFHELPTMTRRIMLGLYREVVADGVGRGIFDVDDPDEAAAHMRALIDGTLLSWAQRPDWAEAHADARSSCASGLLRLLTR